MGIVLNNLNILKNEKCFTKDGEDNAASEKTKTMELVLNNASPSSLYEQHKALLRQRYSLPSCSSSSISSTTTKTSATTESSSLSSSSSSPLNVKAKDEDGFSLRLQNAIRTSSSFVHYSKERMSVPRS